MDVVSSKRYQSATRPLNLRKKPSAQKEESVDQVSLFRGAAEGSISGGMGGILASGLVLGAGVVKTLAEGRPMALAEIGPALADAVSIALIPSLVTGAVVGTTAGQLGFDQADIRKAAGVSGTLSGGAAIGYAIYGALQALESMTG